MEEKLLWDESKASVWQSVASFGIEKKAVMRIKTMVDVRHDF